jgi:hypothetical protein
MKLYPYERHSHRTDLTPDEIKSNLRMYVEKVARPYFHLFAPAKPSRLYGVVGETSFEMYCKPLSNAIPMTIVRGKWVAGASERAGQVTLRYQLNFFSLLLYASWNVLFLSALTLMLLLPGDSRWEVVIPLAFLLIGHWYVLSRFRKDTRFFRQFFRKNLFDPSLSHTRDAFESTPDPADEKDFVDSPQSDRK